MDWREGAQRWFARLVAARPATRARLLVGAVAMIVLAVAAFGIVMSRSGSAASPPGASASASQRGSSSSRSSANADPASVTNAANAANTSSGAASPNTSVVVSVAGAVARPGVVTLPWGARVIDAIGAAGGVRTGADPNALDLAAKLTDGVRVYVPKLGEHVSPMPAGAGGASADGGGAGASGGGSAATNTPVDLNTASAAELEALPGIGPALAQAIVAERTRLGGFRSVDQLREVHGIGDRRLADLRPLVTV